VEVVGIAVEHSVSSLAATDGAKGSVTVGYLSPTIGLATTRTDVVTQVRRLRPLIRVEGM
jgi:hypothetical protein